ncbi:MAG: tetratricopeptide repeat protein [Verrucomicrobia bacterium]|nr:tetratricopeptide repeat protein [Verrucomicrobiota bacterium]
MEQKEKSPFGFVQTQLPWIIGACALVLYFVTVNRWARWESLPTLIRVTGIEAGPVVSAPLLFLLTFPIRWLPVGVQPVALNLLSAVFAALTLVLLARSVALLPYNRTADTRHIERNEHSFLTHPPAWLPPVFAVLLCGLQITFWEHATAGTGEMLDLLLFAYVTRCLLEYRLDGEDRWLYKFAFVYGLAVTNNYGMIAFFPCFLIALIWIMEADFFRLPFLAKMAGFGICGLLLYLVLPIVNVIASPETGGFLTQLRTVVGNQKGMLLAFRPYTYVLLLLSFTSLLPLVIIGIRWSAGQNDHSAAGAATATWILRIVYAFLFVACVSIFFDTKWSPRALGAGYALLPFYYLAALCAGYFAGYFLLILSTGGARPLPRQQPVPKTLRPGGVIVAIVCAVCAIVLAQRNLPLISLGNGKALAQFADLLIQTLPETPAYVVADSPGELMLAQGRLHKRGAADRHVLINSSLLNYGAYHRHLSKRYGQRWPLNLGQEEARGILRPMAVTAVLTALARSNELYYLHPSFGYFFENLHARPKGMTYLLKPYPNDSLLPPPLTQIELDENRKFWQAAESVVRSVHVQRSQVPADREWLRQLCSRAVNAWGVTLQQHGQTKEAEKWFKLAVEVNPKNIPATANLAFNARLQAESVLKDFDVAKAADQIGKENQSIESILLGFGPFDEPAWLYKIAMNFMQASLFRQSLATFDRLHKLIPNNTNVDIWRMTTELMTRFGMGDVTNAEKQALTLHTKYPKEDSVLEALTQMYLMTARFSNALQIVEEQIALDASNRRALLNKAAVCIHLKQYTNAVAALDKLLSLEPDSAPALLNRAIAYLQMGNLDRAKQDYEAVYKALPTSFPVLFGLGEIAYRRNDKTNALKYYEEYLKHAPKDTEEYKQISDRVNGLRAGK